MYLFFFLILDTVNRQLATSEYQLVASLGTIVFYALDYMMPDEEERILSRPLETLIGKMTSTASAQGVLQEYETDDSSQNADEGIEQDSGEDDHILHSDDDAKHRKGISLIQVIELCANHLSCPEQADSHYRAVCRALVAEVLELTTFLENISNRTQMLSNAYEDETDSGTLEKLRIQDWARLWMQVIHQLRQGVKLKKVDEAQLQHPIEYALTPYEMLLDDIRSRRYKLRQVMVNGDIPPRVKKDAHALILEFIRSRPPLVPVSERKLPPTPPRQLTVYEKLMASIKQEHKLKPTPTASPVPERVGKRKIETSRTKLEDTDDTPQPQRRLIKADISLGFSSSYEAKSVGSRERRHSISVCESPPKSGDQTPQCEGTLKYSTPFYECSSRTRSDYWKSSQWQSLECLSLTLEEVVHIRNVLTKAELESLIVDPTLYDDICKGKVCFTCKQVRFSFFGPWKIKCKMCERTVCDKCSSKMRIPTEHFARIPVYMLSPTPSPPPEEEASHSFWKFSEMFGKSEAKENLETVTPKLPRQKTTVDSECPKRKLTFRHSESVDMIADKMGKGPLPTSRRKRTNLQRSKTLAPPEASNKKKSSAAEDDKLKGPLVPVCKDCKVMVCNIIMASQDTVSFDQRKKKRNSRTWPQKRNSTTLQLFMDPVVESGPTTPDDVFSPDSRKLYTP
nr:protein spire isoform X2 [Parasteatoda tepidariorum]